MHYQEQILSCCWLGLVALVNVIFAMLGQEQIEVHYPLNSDSTKKSNFTYVKSVESKKHYKNDKSLEYRRQNILNTCKVFSKPRNAFEETIAKSPNVI